MDSKHLVISINGGIYAIDCRFVLKIVELGSISPLPHTAPCILGSSEADGSLYTVMDLRILLGGGSKPLQKPSVAVLLTYSGSKACVVVDRVISLDDTNAAPEPAALGKNRFVQGFVQTGGQTAAVLSVSSIFRND